MPQIARQTLKMDYAGLDLASPLDKMTPGHFPFVSNIRMIQEGRIEGRPGSFPFSTPISDLQMHSIRRLNDVANAFATSGYIYVVGANQDLWGGTETSLAEIDTGYSGNPLSMVPFRPNNSPTSYMYVYDAIRLMKVRPDGLVEPIGIVPPLNPTLTEAEYGVPATVDIDTGQSTTNWSIITAPGGSSITLVDRQGSGGGGDSTIGSILYVSGTTGWAMIVPSVPGNSEWTGNRMKILLNSGGGNAENVVVREIWPAIASTTVQAVQYDNTNNQGPCSMVITNSPLGLSRNSLLYFTGAYGNLLLRVLAVIPSPDGTTYSIRIDTGANTVSAGDTVIGKVSWYCYTVNNHVAGESITSESVYLHTSGAGSSTGKNSATVSFGAYYSVPVNASAANGRLVNVADDYFHLSLWSTNGNGITQVVISIDVDNGTSSLATAFRNNQYVATLTQVEAIAAPNDCWTEIVIPLSQFVKQGNDPTANLSKINAIMIQTTQVIYSDIAMDWCYLFGTYGPTIQPNSPVGYLYETSFRDSTTGAKSVPGPATRYDLFPLREEVLVTPQTTTAPAVNYCDVYRQGGVLSSFTFDGSVVNNPGNPQIFADVFSDSSIEANVAAPLTELQPWPILQLPWSGTVNVTGTSVQWASGQQFNTALVSGTIILIAGVAYQTYGNPVSPTFLEITSSAGVQNNVPFTIASPILAGQPLPFVFGPQEGPFAPIVFGLGDPLNPGTLYWSNASDFDGASDVNTIEVCPPSEPLISGAVWNGLIFVGSRDNIYVVRYTYLVTQGTAGSFQFQRIPSPSGIWARWACVRGPDGVYFLGRDGIYRATEQGVVSVTDGKGIGAVSGSLYPLFPHDGQNLPPNAATNGVSAPDMTQLAHLRLSACDNDIYFDYVPL